MDSVAKSRLLITVSALTEKFKQTLTSADNSKSPRYKSQGSICSNEKNKQKFLA